MTTVLLFLFLWGEWSNLSLLTKVNDTKINNFFSSVGAILTGFSIIYISMQIKESRKSRKAMSTPDIIPKDTNYISYNSVISLRNVDNNGEAIQAMPFLELYNSGTGAAKKIQVTWLYSGEEVIATLKEKSIGEINEKYCLPDREEISFIPVSQAGQIEPSRFYFQLYRPDMNPKFMDLLFSPDEDKPKTALVLNVNYLDIFGNQHFNNTNSILV